MADNFTGGGKGRGNRFNGVLPVIHTPATILPRVIQNDPTPPGTNMAYRGQWKVDKSKQPLPPNGNSVS